MYMKEKVGFFRQKTKTFFDFFWKRYLRDYLELENKKNMSGYLLIEICSFPGSFKPADAREETKYPSKIH